MPSRRHAAARALARRLRNHPRLRGVTIRDHSGHPKDRAEPAAAECPWIRLTPYGDEWMREAIGRYQTPILVKVETATRGTDDAPHWELWDAIACALWEWEADGFPSEDAPISTIDILAPAEGPDPELDQPDGMTASGRGLLRISLDTEFDTE